MSKDDRTAWIDAPVETAGDAIVASMSAGGIDHLFFTSGSDIGFYQEAIAKAHAMIYTNRSYTTGTASVRRSYGANSYALKGGFEGGYFDPPIDFAKEAEAAGGFGENVTDPGDVAAALRRGLEHVRAGKPAVISVWQKRLEGND